MPFRHPEPRPDLSPSSRIRKDLRLFDGTSGFLCPADGLAGNRMKLRLKVDENCVLLWNLFFTGKTPQMTSP